MDNQLKRPQSPWQQSASSDSNLMPPTKKPRLSPLPPNASSPYSAPSHSPYANSPNLQHVSLPNAYSQQRPQIPNGVQPSFSHPMQSAMGPPQRPPEKPPEKEEQPERHLDINELSDLVTSSGVDLRREEEFMASTLRRDRSNQALHTGSSQAPTPQTNYDLLSQRGFGQLGNRSQWTQAISQKTAEQELNEKHKAAVRAYNTRQQQHLENPFLLGNAMRLRMERIANDNGVKMPMEGLFDRVPREPQNVSGSAARGADGNGIQTLKAPSILNRNSPLDPILSLLSLATSERIRGLVEDSYGLARGRQTTSNGVVPPEWADLAKGLDGANPEPAKTVPASVTNTSWDRHPAGNGTDSSETARSDSQDTIAFPPKENPFVTALAALTNADRKAEEARVKCRKERKAKKERAANSGASTTNGGTPNGASTPSGLPPGTQGEIAPDKPLTKKEREKAAKAEVTDEMAMRNANAAAAMALGTRKRFSWLNPGAAKNRDGAPGQAAPGANRFGGGGGGGTGGAGGRPGDAAVGKDGLPGPGADPKLGAWREDGPGGRDVQMRDWVNVLEGDGREKRTLGYALAQLGKGGRGYDS